MLLQEQLARADDAQIATAADADASRRRRRRNCCSRRRRRCGGKLARPHDAQIATAADADASRSGVMASTSPRRATLSPRRPPGCWLSSSRFTVWRSRQ